MGCFGIILPILGLIGFYNDINWLFYTAGGITMVLDIVALISGQLRCLGSIITIAFWVTCYNHTGKFWDGLILGSCTSTIVMLIGTFVLVAITSGVGTAIVGLTRFFGKINSENN